MQLKNKNPSPHQSPAATASPRWEALDLRKPVSAARSLASPFGGRCPSAARTERVSNDHADPLSQPSADSSPRGRARELLQTRRCIHEKGPQENLRTLVFSLMPYAPRDRAAGSGGGRLPAYPGSRFRARRSGSARRNPPGESQGCPAGRSSGAAGSCG